MNPSEIPSEDCDLQQQRILWSLDSINNNIYELWSFASTTMGRPAHDPLMESLSRLKKELEDVKRSFDVLFIRNPDLDCWGEEQKS